MQERYKGREWKSIEGFVKGEKAATDDEPDICLLDRNHLHNSRKPEGLPSASVAKQACC